MGKGGISVVMPVWNEETHIGETIARVAEQLDQLVDVEAEILVVDDGSTDSTGTTARQALERTGLRGRVITRKNGGRLSARRAGLEAASGSYVLFLDSRVALGQGSLAFVSERLENGEAVWNAHVDIDTGGTLYGRFWRVLTELAFADYFSNPRTTTFDAETFDRFPKGTTCFLAPLPLMREAFGQHTTLYDDERSANDDTPILRWIAERTPIGISPSFSCRYRPRTTLASFVSHAFHRGTVFVDGHGTRASRFFPVVVGLFPLSLAAGVITVRGPRVAAVLLASFVVSLATVARRKGFGRDSTAFGLLAPVYGVAHVAGMWRGLVLAVSSKLRS